MRRFALLALVAACSSGAGPRPVVPARDGPTDLGPTWTVTMLGGTCDGKAEVWPGNPSRPPQPTGFPCPAGLTNGASVRVTELVTDECAILPPGCNSRSCAGAKTGCPLVEIE